jgi:hypothetical protein
MGHSSLAGAAQLSLSPGRREAQSGIGALQALILGHVSRAQGNSK